MASAKWRQLAQEGVDVIIAARSQQPLRAAASEIAAETGRRVITVIADTADERSVNALVSLAVAELSGIDVLINNAAILGGISAATKLEQIVDQEVLDAIDIKVVGYLRTARTHRRCCGGRDQRWRFQWAAAVPVRSTTELEEPPVYATTRSDIANSAGRTRSSCMEPRRRKPRQNKGVQAKKSLVLVLAAVSGNACSDADSDNPKSYARDAGVRQLDRSALTDVGTTERLDYATPEYWVCRPDIEPNECNRDLSATEVKPDGSLEVHEHVPASDPKFDCFYVYPTVWLNMQSPQMTDFSEQGVKLVLDPLLSQAARFSRICRLYAPLYRQAALSGFTIPAGASKDLALQDVRDAFAYYLEHDNHGRKFVLIGHSQGTFMLSSLIARDIDENESLRAQMISALLIGGQPYTPPGEAVGGSFKNVRACTEKGQTGCIIAYNSFAKEAPPPASSILGRVGTELANEEVDLNGQVMCVEPAALGLGGARYGGSYFPMTLNNPRFGSPERPAGIDTPFALYRDLFHGECKHENGFSWLEISVDRQEGDQRTPPVYRNQVLDAIGFGLHLVDYNFTLDDMIEAVSVQADAALK